MENNNQMKLYYPGCIENNRQMKLYYHGCMANKTNEAALPLYTQGIAASFVRF
jgi:hypothetical protein